VVGFQVLRVTAARALAFVSVVGQDLAPGCRRDGGCVALASAADPAIAQHTLFFGFAELQFALAGRYGRFGAVRALVHVDLCGWICGGEILPPGGDKCRHDSEYRLGLVSRCFALLANLFPQFFVARKLGRRHFQGHAHWYDRCRPFLGYRNQLRLPNRLGGCLVPGPLHFLFQFPPRVVQRKIQPAFFVGLIDYRRQNPRRGVAQLP